MKNAIVQVCGNYLVCFDAESNEELFVMGLVTGFVAKCQKRAKKLGYHVNVDSKGRILL